MRRLYGFCVCGHQARSHADTACLKCACVAHTRPTCSVEVCAHEDRGGGLCNRHRIRLQRRGSLVGHKLRDRTQAQRFFDQVDVTESCWLWTGALERLGYALFRTRGGGKKALAHRWSYEFVVGPIPAGLELDHLCRTRHCVNPAHLEPVTHLENVRRAQPYRSVAPR